MKKYLLLILLFLFVFVSFCLPNTSKACTEGYDMAGLRVWVRDGSTSPSTPLSGVQAIYDTTNVYKSTWDSAWLGGTASCDAQGFIRVSSPHTAWGQDGNGSDNYSWGDGVVRNSSVGNFEMLGGGSCYNIGAGTIGVACDCNHLRVFFDMPDGYEFYVGSYDNAYGFNGWVAFDGNRGGNGDGRSWVNYYAPGYDGAHPNRFILEVPIYNTSNGWGNLNLYLRPKTQPKGNLDSATCTLDSNGNPQAVVSGWTCDPDNYSQSNNVHLYNEGRGIDIGQANVYRSDLAWPNNLWACGGNGNHGFSYTYPEGDPVYDGNSHTVYAYGIELPGYPFRTNALLNASPRSFTCPRSGTTTTTSTTTTTAPPLCIFQVNNSSAATVTLGSSVNLSWSNAAGVAKVGRIATSDRRNLGDIDVSGSSISVTPTETTEYTLKNNAGNPISGCGTPTVTVIRNSSGNVTPVAP